MLLKLLLILFDICAFEFTTDTILLAFDRGGVTVQSTKLERKLCAWRCRNFTFQFTIILL